jgi:glycyl-tRNA synthetase beta chain
VDREALDWAARYCKADLASEMIKDGKEFTKLQGLMGREYALAEGVAPARAALLYEHVLPRQAGDQLPATSEGSLLALADRLDALAGLWQAGFAPTGSKDPYALRRQALACLRLLLEKSLPLRLDALIAAALAGYPGAATTALQPALLDFFLSRFEGLMEEAGVAPDVFDAVVESGERRVLDLRARALALNGLRGDPAFERLVIGARRVVNILAKEGTAGDSEAARGDLAAWAAARSPLPYGFQPKGLVEAAEQALYTAVAAAAAPLLVEAAERRYEAAYRRLADLGGAIDAYFDGVLVNVEDPRLRANRLAFLRNLAQLFLHFANFSRVVLEGEREAATPR